MKLNKKGNRWYMDSCWYLVEDGNGEFDVYDDGEYEGKYVGTLEALEAMTEDEAFNYVLKAL
mgnify:CR=1 FL=1